VPYRILFCLLLGLAVSAGCSSSQSVKNAWKGTRSFWYTYMNVPAAIDYGDKGEMPDYETRFSKAIMGIDEQLLNLERAMQNADKPPTPDWLNTFFTQFTWVDGITGLNAEGGIVGQAGRAEKTLDYTPLLESDPKQNLHGLRAHAQQVDGETEIMLAVPLYKGPDFLGVVVAYFELNSLMRYSSDKDDLIISSPDGVLWTGATAGTLPKENWEARLRSQTYGSLSDSSGSYQWVSRYLGNYPLVFAVRKTSSNKPPEKVKEETGAKADAPAGDGDLSVALPETDEPNTELVPLPNL